MEALQKMSDPKLTDCPDCKSAALRKQVTAASFKLKGTGWYETDFKNSGKKPKATAETSTKSDSGTTSTATSTATSN
jgi:putative FmdB family regulatory protein